MRKFLFRKATIVAALAALAVMTLGGGTAVYAMSSASSSSLPPGQYANGVFRACVQTVKPYAVRAHLGAASKACPKDTVMAVWSNTGRQGLPGPKGAPGAAGANAVVTVTASTKVTDRNDSGVAGNWAKDTFGRSITVSRTSAAEASKCGASAVKCWFYTGEIIDLGTFETISGANTPQDATKTISGVVKGSFGGGAQIEFYASDGSPDATGVAPTLAGNGVATTDWHKQFFNAGTAYSAVNLVNWGWQYNAPALCETWTNSKAANLGNITGVNACV